MLAIAQSEDTKSLLLDTQTIDSSPMVDELVESGSVNVILWGTCTNCNKAHYTREKCWKVHGKPPSQEWGQKGERSARKNELTHVAVAGTNEENKPESTDLDQEEIERVRIFLGSLEKPTGTCTLAYSSKLPFSFGLCL